MPGDYAFQQSGPESPLQALLIQFWQKGSKITIWKGSHHKRVVTVQGENNLWRAPRVALQRQGAEPVQVEFEHGGLSVEQHVLYNMI